MWSLKFKILKRINSVRYYNLTGTNASGSFLYKHFTIRHLQAAIFQNLQEFETFNFPNFIVALFRCRKFNFVATYRFLYPLKPFIFSEFLLTIVNKRITMITMEHSQKYSSKRLLQLPVKFSELVWIVGLSYQSAC